MKVGDIVRIKKHEKDLGAGFFRNTRDNRDIMIVINIDEDESVSRAFWRVVVNHSGNGVSYFTSDHLEVVIND